MVVGHLHEPCALVAQSMGGYLAIRAAARAEANVTHLVLAATSGGVDLAGLGVTDWRLASRAANAHAPDWAFERTSDLTEIIASTIVPVLLLWATDDAISPRRVGEHLLTLFPNGRLTVFDCDDHWFARIHSPAVAETIEGFLTAN